MAKKGKKGGPKYYAVAVGRIPGVYYTWPECQAQTSGYSGAIFKSFEIMHEAQSFLRLNGSSSSSSITSSFIPAANASSSRAGIATPATGHDNESTHRGTKRPHPGALGTTTDVQHSSADPSLVPVITSTSTTSKQSSNHRTIRITIYFDGGSRGNPGVAGAGAHVLVMEEERQQKNCSAASKNETNNEFHVRKYCGVHCTNNYAEYSGLLAGLEVAKSCIVNLCKTSSVQTTELPSIHLEIYGDSNLVVQQMLGVWQCKNDNIRPLFNRCKAIIREINECIVVAAKKAGDGGVGGNDGSPTTLSGGKSSIVPTFGHIRRNLNGVADSLANEAMDARRSWTTSTVTASAADKDCSNEIHTMKKNGENGGKGSVVADKDSNDSDGNESHFSC